MFSLEEDLKNKIGIVNQIRSPIVFVGMMGCGKTTVGKGFAKLLRRRFVDIDKEIEAREKRQILDIFNTDGEEYFRKIEAEEIKKFCSHDKTPIIISIGGGGFINDESRRIIKENCISIFLNMDINLILKYIALDKKRPLALNKSKTDIEKILNDRLPKYKEANIEVLINDVETKASLVNRIISSFAIYVEKII